jgi:hypothetical protein
MRLSVDDLKMLFNVDRRGQALPARGIFRAKDFPPRWRASYSTYRLIPGCTCSVCSWMRVFHVLLDARVRGCTYFKMRIRSSNLLLLWRTADLDSLNGLNFAPNRFARHAGIVAHFHPTLFRRVVRAMSCRRWLLDGIRNACENAITEMSPTDI